MITKTIVNGLFKQHTWLKGQHTPGFNSYSLARLRIPTSTIFLLLNFKVTKASYLDLLS